MTLGTSNRIAADKILVLVQARRLIARANARNTTFEPLPNLTFLSPDSTTSFVPRKHRSSLIALECGCTNAPAQAN